MKRTFLEDRLPEGTPIERRSVDIEDSSLT
jgi:hypothetical protein